MGQRGSIETVVAIFRHFRQDNTWSQAKLAEAIGIGTPALRKHLLEMQRAGFPFVSEEEHPHVYWSVPKNWMPGAVALESDEASEVLRQLGRLPRTKSRDKLIKAILQRLSGTIDPEPAVVGPALTAEEERNLPIVEDAATGKRVLRMRYYSSSRGHVTLRYCSVQRVVVGPPARFIAMCHASQALRWFRVGNIAEAVFADDQPFILAKKADIDRFEQTSLDGYHDAVPAAVEAFFVRDPEARWVANNLLGGMTVKPVDGGIRVEAETSALSRLARYVVGLGGAARPETAGLAAMVAELANGALTSARR